jgi:hypothetical protein
VSKLHGLSVSARYVKGGIGGQLALHLVNPGDF